MESLPLFQKMFLVSKLIVTPCFYINITLTSRLNGVVKNIFYLFCNPILKMKVSKVVQAKVRPTLTRTCRKTCVKIELVIL